ncbi:MAG: phosphotransferase, partial [Anaerobacillus sp.]
MEEWIQAVFSDAIIDEALNRFGGMFTNKKKLGDFENYVYEVKQGEEFWILRLTHSSHRTFEEIEAEIDWVNELHRGGVNVSRAYSSSNDKMVETVVVENGRFFACLFKKAPGFGVKTDDPSFGPQLYEAWGREVGKMHRISMQDHPRGRRHRWDESDLLRFAYLTNNEDSSLIKDGEKLVEEIKSFHETGETFGLIHSDVHHGNFYYDGKEIHLFDFDDSMYHYYVSDIAIPVYYADWRKCGNESKEVRTQCATEFLYWFLKGYRKETT